MLVSEPILAAVCAYLSLVYAIFYTIFQLFPVVFQQRYGLSPAAAGLCYLPIAAGASFSLPLFWAWDRFLAKARRNGASWARRPECHRLPLVCLGGPLFALSLFWLGFGARPAQSFITPLLAGIPLGFGFSLAFASLLNYLTDAYDLFAASAHAAASTSRSLLALIFPLATSRLFSIFNLTGVCSLLGGLSAGSCLIPFLLLWKASLLGRCSPFFSALRQVREQIQSELQTAAALQTP